MWRGLPGSREVKKLAKLAQKGLPDLKVAEKWSETSLNKINEKIQEMSEATKKIGVSQAEIFIKRIETTTNSMRKTIDFIPDGKPASSRSEGTESPETPPTSVIPPWDPVEPQVVRIVQSTGDNSFELNTRVLESILLNPKFADKKVAVISVAGAYRKGKSFLLNFFLRYLTWRSKADKVMGEIELENEQWMSPNSPLSGFSWRGGSERDTNGILIWSQPFLMKDKNGEEIAVLLMDTQGTFDYQTTVKDGATIFALSTMVSSVQIYNLSQNIQEDDLQHLQLFTEYGRLALEDTSAKPFQSLLFLVRDWSFPYEAEFGFQGGQRILEKRLEVSKKQHVELQQLRQHIRSCFDDIRCFLMPHPGLKVATNPNFDGKLVEVETDFQQQLGVLVPGILDTNSLVQKEINGQRITCRQLLEYLKVYMGVFKGSTLPDPKSILHATSEANNMAAVALAHALYKKMMEEACQKGYLFITKISEEHEKSKDAAVLEFRSTKKMGGVEYSMSFEKQLEEDLEKFYEEFEKINDGKRPFWMDKRVLWTGVTVIGASLGGALLNHY